jgi:hypothetical protein
VGCRAELVQDVADVLLDGVEGDYEFVGDPPVRLSGGQQAEYLQLAGGQRVNQAGRGGDRRAGARRGWFGVEGV